MEKKQQKRIFVNGEEKNIFVSPESTLSDLLREQLGLIGTKVGCDSGQCGACSVILDGKVIRSCITKMKRVANGARLTTIEGVGRPDALHPLQKSWMKHGGAQCGFCTPGFIVSAKGLLDENPSPSREDVRDWFKRHHNACRCTGYKPLVDAVMDAADVQCGKASPESLDFTMPEDGRIWGSKYPRPTAVGKVTGSLEYGADIGVQMPADTLHLALVTAKVHHANIQSIETSAAEKMPGVHSVLTAKDVPGNNRIFQLAGHPNQLGDGWERPILCDTKIFQYGDPLAVVCADTRQHAREAAEKVVVEVEELPAYLSALDAMEKDAREIHAGVPNVYFHQPLIKGEDSAPFFERDDVVIAEGEFVTSRQPHMPIEADVGFAYMGEDGLLHIHSKSIAVHLHAFQLAEGLGLKPEQIAVASNPMGGTFGYKLGTTLEGVLGVAALKTGRPVHLQYTYAQQMASTSKRSPYHIKARMAADRESGRILALEHEYYIDHGPYSEFAVALLSRGIQFIGAGYDIPNIRGKGHVVTTNHSWGVAYRGFGGVQCFFAGETLAEDLAEALGMDPFEFRLKNVYGTGSTTPTGQTPDVLPYQAMFEVMRPRYELAKERVRKDSTPAVKKGVGIAIGVYGAGGDGEDEAFVFIQYDADNGVTVGASWEDHGQGADIGAVGTAHEALRPMDIPPEKIRFSWPDSSKQPPAGPAGASRSQIVVGGAIKNGCEKLLEAARREDGSFMTCEEMIAAGKEVRFDGSCKLSGRACDPATGLGSPFVAYMYSLNLAEVAVEMATGKVTVEHMATVTDLGKINNRLAVEGQVLGCMYQGIGLALREDYDDVKRHSTMTGAGFTFIDAVPDDMSIHFIEENPRQWGTYGASGAGEGPMSSPHMAIINAVRNACGARMTRLPATPERVLAAMKK